MSELRPTLTARLRRRAGAFLIDNLFLGLSTVGRLHPAAHPARHGVERFTNLPYLPSGDPAHTLDIYRPKDASGPLPVVLYIHGGGFRILSKDSHWVAGLAFARAGYVVFNINYRLAPRHPFPAAISDCADALAFVAARAADYGGDLSRLVFAGESAGANLAVTLALLCCVARPEPYAQRAFSLGVVPRAVSAQCGIYQVSDVARFARRRLISSVVFDRLEEVSDSYLQGVAPGSHDLADPLLLLESGPLLARPLPAVFASVGTRDRLLDDTRRLHAALRRLGAPVEVAYYPGEMHAFQMMIFRSQARRYWRHLYDFLARHETGPTRAAPPLEQVLFGKRARPEAA